MSIKELADQYTELVPCGKHNHIGCCPFHEERMPSFVIDADTFYCFGCKVGGTEQDFENPLDERGMRG